MRGVASDRAPLDPITDVVDLGAVGRCRPFDLRPLDHHITPIEELTEQDPIRLEQIGWVSAVSCDGEPQEAARGSSRHQWAARTEPGASRSPDRLRLTAAW
jgi:hypothetical protein